MTVIRTVPPRSSGVGSSILHQATVTLTNAQIITLPTISVTIVDAVGSGLVIIPIWTINRLDPSAGAYTNIAGANTILKYGYGTGALTGFGLQENPTEDYPLFDGNTDILTAYLAPKNIQGGNTDVADSFANKALGISVANGASGNFTGGNDANTLIASVAYLTLNTTTGVFV